ncbi:ARM repeat-containing protein [Mycena alexandri]|uniref:ARM repeat-containing protein n=1 Tax=Mycena alexandri TaxID=1745969 RepID=A0AAD6SY11_9AGAR|nr:ARM repeat-containing protein [Mycena alexandri]
MTFTPITVSSLKTIKNTVIGNPSAKVQLAQDQVFVQHLVQCLNDPPPTDPREDDLRIEAAHVVASISYGSEAVLGTLLRCDAPRAFLYAVSKFVPDDTAALRSAFARGLRALAIAVADTVGPSQWGLREERSSIKNDAEAALDYLFQPESLDLYLPLLLDPSARVSIARLLAFAVRNAEHRTAVATWLPPEDRLKEVKTKRGWEKTVASPNAPSRQGGWVCRNLTALIGSKDAKLQEAALWGLASIAKDNANVAAALSKTPVDRVPSLLAVALTMAKSRATDTQLAACLWCSSVPVSRLRSKFRCSATSIIRATLATHPTNTIPPADDTSARTIMNVVNRIISSPTEPLTSRTKACFILYYLVTDHPALAFSAFDRGCLGKLAAVLHDLSPSTPRAEWEEDESESIAGLREGALTTVAAIALFDNTIRRSVTDDMRLLAPIHSALSHRHVGVRYAACQCVRALSRAVAVLRTNIVDSGLGMAVFQIFKKETDEDRRVTAAALAAVCNIVNEFSPLRPIYLDLGLMPRLVKLLNGGDATLRLSALWAVKNLLGKTSGETKRDVMQCLGWTRLVELLEETDGAVQEQAFHLVRNLAENEPGIEMIFRELGASAILRHITTALSAEDDDVVLQATYILANIANGAAAYQSHLLASPPLLAALRRALAERGPQVRRPAVSAILELARTSTAARRALGEAGVAGTLRQMCSASAGFHSPLSAVGSGFQREPGAANSRANPLDDDRDVIEQAKTALDWLEHGEAYR